MKRPKNTINQMQGGVSCLDTDLNQPPKMLQQVIFNTIWTYMTWRKRTQKYKMPEF